MSTATSQQKQPPKPKPCAFISSYTGKQLGCGEQIFWDSVDEQWREVIGNKLHTRDRCKEIRISKGIQQAQQQQQQQEGQPQQQAQQESPSEQVTPENNKMELIWAMIKEINYKADKIAKVEENSKNLIDFMNARMDKIDRFIAKVYEKLEPDQFAPASKDFSPSIESERIEEDSGIGIEEEATQE